MDIKHSAPHVLWCLSLADEPDSYVLELAIAGNAEVIVTDNVRDCGI